MWNKFMYNTPWNFKSLAQKYTESTIKHFASMCFSRRDNYIMRNNPLAFQR